MIIRRFSVVAFLALTAFISACGGADADLLVFTGAGEFRHGSTAAGVEAIRAIAEDLELEVVVADSADVFNEDALSRASVVVFLNTSGDVLNYQQQAEMERFIQSGGGFAGIHGAAETEQDWEWYVQLVGGSLEEPLSEFPRMTPGTVAAGAPSTGSWEITDEWHRIRTHAEDLDVLLRLEDSRLPGGEQPIAWTHAFDGGRSFYTALGHNPEVFESSEVRSHLESGIRYVLGEGGRLDYSRSRTRPMPDENRFERTILADSLDEPTELEVLGNGRILFVERKGDVKIYDPEAGGVRTIAHIDVNNTFEDGLMGVALDPAHEQNNWIYLYYSPPGAEPKQHLSRFELRNDSLLMETEVIMLVVPTQRDECCHTAGSVEFGPDGNLYLSTGDNTNPFESEGFGPFDERPGRSPFDAQGSSANTNDLRGKILRITPRSDGTYGIPEGNLFPPGTENARPEIYVMGNRNPYRISIDQKTGFLYWGEVGPDAGESDSTRGPRGHDEVNQARRAGFFGWPYFVGNNKAYRDFNFAARRSGPSFDPKAPQNDSPNNTGLRELPPAQPAFIWYPYAESPEFPIVRTGGRNAMAGPVFHADRFTSGAGNFPEYFDGKLFIYDWMRGWILVVTMDESGDLRRLEPFMPSTRWNNPIDMAFDRNGILYVLEYGTGWFSKNPDARLNRIEYDPGNRTPVARLTADTSAGAVPLTVRFSGASSGDPDGDALTYEWNVHESNVRTDASAFTHTFERPGTYEVVLKVIDPDGSEAEDRLEIVAGNAPPKIEIAISGNRSFYWDDRRIDYDVNVTDPEEGEIAPDAVRANAVYVSFSYTEEADASEVLAMGHRLDEVPTGRRMMEESDCMACHSTAAASIGPSFVDVALRYREQPDAVPLLSAKIIQGGGGVWGEQAMAAHPQLSQSQAATMVEFILSLARGDGQTRGLPLSGNFETGEHEGEAQPGSYVLRARYADSGAPGAPSAVATSVVVLRNTRVQAEHFDVVHGADVREGGREVPSLLENVYDGAYLIFRDIDLTDVSALAYHVKMEPLHSSGGRIELYLDSPQGPLVSRAEVAAGASGESDVTAPIESAGGVHDLYFVFRNDRGLTPEGLFLLDWIEFIPTASNREG